MTELYNVITTGSGLALWQFSRSFVNYGLVIVLIIAAFANVLRISLDTYSVKKVLPGLVTGFVLANLSLFICKTILQLSDSIVTTVNHLGLANTTIIDITTSGMQGVVVGAIAAISASLIFGAGVGLILLAGVALIIIFFPVIAWLGILFVLVSRYYVVQYLVAFSPIFFMALGVPFLQSWFQRWWKYFMTWVFMKPIAYGLLYLGALVIQAKVGGPLIAYIVGLFAMYSAVVIPFRSGGAINKAYATVAKRLGGGAAAGAGRGLTTAGDRLTKYGNANNNPLGSLALGVGSSVGKLGRGITAAPHLPSAIKGKIERNAALSSARGAATAASLIGDSKQLEHLEDTENTEIKKDLKDKTSAQLVDELRETKDEKRITAIWDQISENGDDHRVFNAIDREIADGSAAGANAEQRTTAAMWRSKLGLGAREQINDARIDPATGRTVSNTEYNRMRARVVSMGGSLGTPDANGEQEINGPTLVKRKIATVQKNNQKNNKVNESNSINARAGGRTYLRSQAGIDQNTPGFAGDTPLEQVTTKAKPDLWYATDSFGNIIGLKDGFRQSIESGVYNESFNETEHMRKLTGTVIDPLRGGAAGSAREAGRIRVRQQLTDIAAAATDVRTRDAANALLAKLPA